MPTTSLEDLLSGISDNAYTEMPYDAVSGNIKGAMDQVTDNSHKTVTFAKSASFAPDYIKNASEESLTTVPEGLSAISFADRVNRALPLHTKEACYMSTVYALNAGTFNGVIKERLEKAARAYGITGELEEVKKAFETKIEEVHVPSVLQHALYVKSASGQLQGVYPLRSDSPEEIRATMDKVEGEFLDGTLPLPLFKNAAVRLVGMAKAAGCEDAAQKGLYKTIATPRLPEFDKMAVQLKINAPFYPEGVAEELSSSWEALQKEASEGSCSKDFGKRLMAFCDTCMEVDIATGTAIKCAGYQDPYSCIFTGYSSEELHKMASSVFEVYGQCVPMDALTDDALEALQPFLSAKQASDLSNAVKSYREEGADHLKEASTVDALMRSMDNDTQRDVLQTLATR